MIGAILTMIGYTQEVGLNPGAHLDIMERVFDWSCLIPAVGLGAVALALMMIYPLNKSRVEANAAELARRRGV